MKFRGTMQLLANKVWANDGSDRTFSKPLGIKKRDTAVSQPC